MREDYTHLVFVMDRSGSMHSMQEEATNSFNAFIREQQKVEGEATLTFVQFDDKYEVVHDFTPIADVGEFQLEPRNMTALLDAIGKTINDVGDKLATMDEADRPAKVLFTVLTDGYENASHEFTGPQIKEMIERQEGQYNWTFMFMGANQDSITVAKSYGMSAGNAVNFAANGVGACSGVSTICKATKAYRAVDYDMTTKGMVLSSNQAEEDEMLS